MPSKFGLALSGDGVGFYNVYLLALVNTVSLSISTSFITIAPLLVYSLGNDNSKSVPVFSIAFVLFGSACSALVSGTLFKLLGRYWGFNCGCALFISASTFGLIAAVTVTPEIAFLACWLCGFAQGILGMIRFAATECLSSNDKAMVPLALTYVLSGGIVAAIIGPLYASHSIHMIAEYPFAGPFVVQLCLICISMILLGCIDFPPPTDVAVAKSTSSDKEKSPKKGYNSDKSEKSDKSDKSNSSDKSATSNSDKSSKRESIHGDEKTWGAAMYKWANDTKFIYSVVLSTFANVCMTTLMTNVTVAMIDIFHYTAQEVSLVLMCHFLGMFVPGLMTGRVIMKIGLLCTGLSGLAFSFIALIIALCVENLVSFIFIMTFIGIGWNANYSTGNVLLLKCTHVSQTKMPLLQAIHDFIVILTSALFVIISGLLLQEYGWSAIVYMNLFICTFFGIVLYTSRKILIRSSMTAKQKEDLKTAKTAARERASRDSMMSRVSVSQTYPQSEAIRATQNPIHVDAGDEMAENGEGAEGRLEAGTLEATEESNKNEEDKEEEEEEEDDSDRIDGRVSYPRLSL